MGKEVRRIVGADIEILDLTGGDEVLLPGAVRINGTDVAIPQGTVIKVNDISDGDLVTVTLTLFARSVTIRAEDPD